MAGRALNATATHDTKRGEDARMRIAAIAELPDAWLGAVATFDREIGEGFDDAESRWLFYQALLGGWQQPADDGLRDRVKTYMEKAVREAKRQTSWLGPDEEYEAGLMAFIDRAFASQRFLGLVDELGAPFIETGRRKSLVQLALKLLAPGIPDIYQGTETFDLSFVDPDNRRPVDFEGLRQPPDRDDAPHGSRLKVPLMRFGLALRRQRPELFAASAYRPLELSEDERLLAFIREAGSARLLLVADLSGRRRDVPLPDTIASARFRSSFPEGVADRSGIPSALAETSIFVGLAD